MNDKQFCTFFVNNLLFGVEVMDVEEIMSQHKIEPVPLAPPTVAGLVNHRGQIVTAINMRQRLGFSERAPGARCMMLIARTREEIFGLLVDRIGDVCSVNEEDFEPTPETVTPEAKELVLGAYKMPNHLLMPLSLARVTEIVR